MTDNSYNVLFLCTGNSARSIMAECILNRLGRGRFKAYSAGSHPKGAVHPYALELLERENFITDKLRSKAWKEFAKPGAPPLNFVFTVCDKAGAEVCPVWPANRYRRIGDCLTRRLRKVRRQRKASHSRRPIAC